MAERLYATSSQHIELAQYICYFLNDSLHHLISTSTRIYLLDLLIDLRPSPENCHHRLDLRTFHVLRRTLWEIAEGRDIGERHFLQDVLRWTVDCYSEQVWSRLRTMDGGQMLGKRIHRQRYVRKLEPQLSRTRSQLFQ